MHFFLFVDDAKAAFIAQHEDKLRQLRVTDAGPELAVEHVQGDLAQGVFVNFIERFVELLEGWLEKRALKILDMVLEAFIGAEPCAARAAELPAHALFLLDDVLDARPDQDRDASPGEAGPGYPARTRRLAEFRSATR